MNKFSKVLYIVLSIILIATLLTISVTAMILASRSQGLKCIVLTLGSVIAFLESVGVSISFKFMR